MPGAQQAIDVPTHRLSSAKLKAWVSEKLSCPHTYCNASANSDIVRASQHVTRIHWEPKLNTRFTRLFSMCNKESGHKTRAYSRDKNTCAGTLAENGRGGLIRERGHIHRTLKYY